MTSKQLATANPAPDQDDAIRATGKADDYETHVKAAKLWGIVADHYEDADNWKAASFARDAQHDHNKMATEFYRSAEKDRTPAPAKRTRKAAPKPASNWRELIGGTQALAF